MKVELIKHLSLLSLFTWLHIFVCLLCDEGGTNKAFSIIVVHMVIYIRLSFVRNTMKVGLISHLLITFIIVYYVAYMKTLTFIMTYSSTLYHW